MARPVPDALTRPGEARHLLITGIVLLALAGASWGLAHLPLGRAATPVALGIALCKALLVAAVFMRLARGTTAARFSLAIALAFIVLLVTGVVTDVLLR